ncbi:MAG: hypothetical protein M3Y60_14845, partial [Bacteroidota bacterium]|nr:hypothetical protein [Bacteroidota bacterium]
MRSIIFISLLILLQSSASVGRFPPGDTVTCLSSEEKKLYELMMDYRKSKGLEPIRISASLT